MVTLSIVTVNFNNEKGIEKTLSSIKSQHLPDNVNIEVNIIDGDSRDGSLEIIDRYGDIIANIVSEPDDGIYDAMNKGIHLSTGEYLLFLNSGDYFTNVDSLFFICENIKAMSYPSKVIFWPVKNILTNGDAWYYPNEKESVNLSRWLKKNLPNHQAMLFPISFYKLNLYDLNILIASDADYKYRAIKQYGSIYFDKPLTVFSIGGVSSAPLDFKRYKIMLKDSIVFFEKNYIGIERYIKLSESFFKFTIKYILSNISSSLYVKFLAKVKGRS